MKKMNQWEMAQHIVDTHHCADFACKMRLGQDYVQQTANCPLCSMQNKWGSGQLGCCLDTNDDIVRVAAEWMSDHLELNPALQGAIPCGDEQLRDPENWLSGSNLMLALADELDRAEKLHPDWPNNLVYQAAILMEEAGEFMQAVMNYKFHGGSPEDVVREVVQTGAMVLRFMKNLPECENILASIKAQKEEGHE